MNSREFIAMLARMESKPNDMDWAAIHKIAQDLTIRNVRNVIDDNPQQIKIAAENHMKDITGVSSTQIGVAC
jgi:hypothetical protein